MNDVPDSELLSAYLDGELSAAERARVEQLLATSQDARQLLEELRALSAILRSLPPYQLQEDLRETILSRAQRQIVAEPARAEDDAPSPPLWQGIFRRALAPRSVISTSLIVLVAVMLMLNERQQRQPPGQNQVAMAPRRAADRNPMPVFRAAPEERALKPATVATPAAAAPARELGIPAEVLVVQCDVSPEAARQQVLERVLAKNQIAWQPPANAEAKMSARPPDRIYVEATPTQIENALAAIAQNHAAFSSVVVQPAPDVPVQQPWTRYTRSGAGLAQKFDFKRVPVASGAVRAARSKAVYAPPAEPLLARSAETPRLEVELQEGYGGGAATAKQRVLFVLRVVDAQAVETSVMEPAAAPTAAPSGPKP